MRHDVIFIFLHLACLTYWDDFYFHFSANSSILFLFTPLWYCSSGLDSFRYVLRGDTAGLCSISILSLLNNFHADFRSGSTRFYSDSSVYGSWYLHLCQCLVPFA